MKRAGKNNDEAQVDIHKNLKCVIKYSFSGAHSTLLFKTPNLKV